MATRVVTVADTALTTINTSLGVIENSFGMIGDTISTARLYTKHLLDTKTDEAKVWKSESKIDIAHRAGQRIAERQDEVSDYTDVQLKLYNERVQQVLKMLED